ncbi:hypothetical protein SDC9_157555 [bioreactor metagenome]|uniref:Uncharacterized protein n=1 Tax=bioreactor metagenome TaxID=1076179 RepID=A0A645F8M5_9ZZZZ
MGLDHVVRRDAQRPAHDMRLQGQQIARQGIGSPRQFLRMHQPSHLGRQHRGGHTIGIDCLADRVAQRFHRAFAADIDCVVLAIRITGHDETS